MSRIMAALVCSAPLLCIPVAAQEVYGPVTEFEGEEDTPNPLDASQPCETQAQEDGVILVCRELTESERYMSPLPREVQSDRVIMPGLNDPPCWVTNPGAGCIRMGWAPEPAIMIDVTAFPEELSEEELAAVSAVAGEAADQPIAIGERVAIDLSEEDDD